MELNDDSSREVSLEFKSKNDDELWKIVKELQNLALENQHSDEQVITRFLSERCIPVMKGGTHVIVFYDAVFKYGIPRKAFLRSKTIRAIMKHLGHTPHKGNGGLEYYSFDLKPEDQMILVDFSSIRPPTVSPAVSPNVILNNGVLSPPPRMV